MTSDDTALSPWERIANKALEQIPQLLVAAIAALVLFSAGLWLDHRDHAHAIADLQRAVDALPSADVALGTSLAELSAACVRRPECEQTRDQFVHLRHRIAHIEGKMGLGVTHDERATPGRASHGAGSGGADQGQDRWLVAAGGAGARRHGRLQAGCRPGGPVPGGRPGRHAGPAPVSKRIWDSALPLLSTIAYALLDLSLISAFVQWLQAHPGASWGVAADFVAASLPIVSKVLDPRPVRPDAP